MKSFTHGGKKAGSLLMAIVLENPVRILYLKYLHLLFFGLVVLLEFVLEICMCVLKGYFPCVWLFSMYFIESSQKKRCRVCSDLQNYTGQHGCFSVCESHCHTEKKCCQKELKSIMVTSQAIPRAVVGYRVETG